MNKKILAVIIAIVVIVGAIGVIAYQMLKTSPALITVTYQAPKASFNYIDQSVAQVDYHTQYYGWTTSMTFYVNFTSTKSATLNIANFYLTYNGNTLPTISHDSGTTSITGGYINPDLFTFILEVNVTSYQLACHASNVNIVEV